MFLKLPIKANIDITKKIKNKKEGRGLLPLPC